MRYINKYTIISVVFKFTKGHSSRKICLSQAPWLAPVIMGLRRPVMEDIKCEESVVHVVSLGLARTTQQNHSSKKTQTKRQKMQEEARKQWFTKGLKTL